MRVKSAIHRIVKESIQRYSFSIHSNVSMRTFCIEKTEKGTEYFVFRGDEHHIFVHESDGSWSVIDDESFLHSQVRQAKKDIDLWSHLASLSLHLTKYPFPAGDPESSDGPREPLPMVDSMCSVGIPRLRAFLFIKQMYPQYFADGRLSQCPECGTVFLPAARCPYGHIRAESPEIVRLARCLLIQFELGIAFAFMSKKSQEEWTPRRRLMWLKQGRNVRSSGNCSVRSDESEPVHDAAVYRGAIYLEYRVLVALMLTTQLLSVETMGGAFDAEPGGDPHIQLVFHASLPK